MKTYLSIALALGLFNLASAQNQTPGAATNASVESRRTPTASMIERKAKDDRSGTAWFVKAPDARIVFTGQVTASNVALDTAGQAEDALNTLREQLKEAGTDLSHILRLNVYVANPELTPAVEQVIARRFADAPPAVTLAYTPLAKLHARVAFDAIALYQTIVPPPTAAADSRAQTIVPESLRKVQFTPGGVAIMPPGGKVFVAGQANPGPGLGNSVKAIMPNLFKALEHVGLGKESVVQVKAFIKPFSEHAVAVAEIKASFGNLPMPPVVLVEWTTTQPAEIELIASAPDLRRPVEDAAAYLSLPGMTTSPVFSRISTVAAGAPLIFISGIDGGQGGTPREQWKRVFDQLGTVLWESGSSFRHMVKATYFLHDMNAREQMTSIRGVYYDPTRPPSASALDVAQMPRPGRLVMLDMIAVPVK
jgi:enamine deaminase RidA (YjgF/YER057c/UK114 family)